MNPKDASTNMSKPLVTLVLDVSSIEQVLDPSQTPFTGPHLHPDIASHLVRETQAHPKADRFEVVFRAADHDAGTDAELAKAVRHFAADTALQATREIRQIMKDGWTSLWIGMLAVIVMLAIAEVLPLLSDRPTVRAIGEGIVIFYWVILWRPAELLLYDHLAPRRRRRLAECLSRAAVRVERL